MVMVYSTPGCPGCHLTCKHLDKCGVEYQLVDITTDRVAADVVAAFGYTHAPVVVAGDQHWSGYRPDRIEALAR